MTFYNSRNPAPMRAVPLPNTTPPTPACPGFCQQAGTFDRPDYLLDPDLIALLDVHVAMHTVPGLKIEGQRGLLIVGEPGDTKSTTIRVHASRRGLDLLQMPAADLSGATEGQAAQRLNEAHAYIKATSAEMGRPFVFLLDDLDASILEERADQERTVNTNVLLGKLQSILETADHFRDANDRPIAFVFTANTIRNLRAPLLRDGCCRVIRYQPTWQWKAEALIHHFRPENERDRKRLRCLVYKYKSHSMAWFTALAAELRHCAIAAAVAKHGLDDHEAIVRAAHAATFDVRTLFPLAKARHRAVAGEEAMS